VVGEDGKLTSRLIEVEAELPHLYIVSKGLSEKDRVLLEGFNRVHEGDFIEEEFVPPERFWRSCIYMPNSRYLC
jgi:membrane fusion protein (multidrug efflux system)